MMNDSVHDDPAPSTRAVAEACRRAAYAIWSLGILPSMLYASVFISGFRAFANDSAFFSGLAAIGLLGLGFLLRLRLAVWVTMVLSALTGGYIVLFALGSFGAVEGSARARGLLVMLGACILLVAIPRLWRLDRLIREIGGHSPISPSAP